jgi:spermidine synthase
MDAADTPTRVLDRVRTPRGELVLRRTGDHFEVISNGTFLMDTRDGRSERALVRAALHAHGAARTLLVGGLGVGFSLVEAVADTDLERVVVVEIEQQVVDWHRTHLARLTAGALSDPRVEVVVADVVEHLAAAPAAAYDAICLDTDNGPDWTVTEANAALYAPSGLDRVSAALAADGVLAVWSAHRSETFEDDLRQHFPAVHVVEVATDVVRAAPDVIYLARRVGTAVS